MDKQLESFMIKATAMLALAISTGNNQAYVEVCNAAKNCIAKVVGVEQAEYFVEKVLVHIAYDMKDEVAKVYAESIK